MDDLKNNTFLSFTFNVVTEWRRRAYGIVVGVEVSILLSLTTFLPVCHERQTSPGQMVQSKRLNSFIILGKICKSHNNEVVTL